MFTQEVADTICAGLADGKSLRAVCAAQGMPHHTTVLLWTRENDAFAQQYARAREDGYSLLADEIVDIADEECTMVRASKHKPAKPADEDEDAEVEVVFDQTAVARNRLRVDTRKWMLSKMLPKVYGDKVDLNHGGSVNVSMAPTDGGLL